MKKTITIFMIILMIISAAYAEGYTPELEMTMNDFILKYNAIQAPLEAPYTALSTPFNWTVWNEYHIAWFHSDKNATVTILLMTKDPSDKQSLSSGLDKIQIFAKSDSDLVPLIGIANRCATIFSTDLLGTSLSPHYIASAICYYYENNCREKDLISYYSLDENSKNVIAFFYSDTYYFQISTLKAVQ